MDNFSNDRKILIKKILLDPQRCFCFLQDGQYINKTEMDLIVKRLLKYEEYTMYLLRLNILSQSQIKYAVSKIVNNVNHIREFLSIARKLDNVEVWNKFRLRAINNLCLFGESIVNTLEDNFYSNKLQYNNNELTHIWKKLQNLEKTTISNIAVIIIKNYEIHEELRSDLFNSYVNDFSRIRHLVYIKYKFTENEKETIYNKYADDLFINKISAINSLMGDLNNFKNQLTEDCIMKIFNKYKKIKYLRLLNYLTTLNINEKNREEIESFVIMSKLIKGN